MYVDVLLAVNLMIDYFLLLLVAKFLHLSVRRYRLLFGALIGAGGSLIILLPPLAPLPEMLLRLGLSLPITLASFGFRGFPAFMRQVLTLFLFSFALAGIFLAVWYFIAPGGLFVKNSVIYFYVPPLLLVVLTLFGYFLLRLFQRSAERRAPRQSSCQLQLSLESGSAVLSAQIDTGSDLREPFSGLPVIVAEERALPPRPKEAPRVVPFTSVGGEGLLKAWRAKDCTLLFPGGAAFQADCYIAYTKQSLAGGAYQALVPPALLQGEENDGPQGKIIRKGKEYAGKIEALASPFVCCTNTLHQRPRNPAAAAYQRGRGKNL
ncbi:MAG: sigma-E processing peptidase SpoIIGA [Oscillospiraceae bacterium]|nr:sigma-E processing peptidase SpoIIGA [Oscillospiraceae bacterium]MDD3261663.1 sigma-E processing peptidase SpoIIGA [Oscillospiraceae bacterium]